MKNRSYLVKKLIYLSTYRGRYENEQLLKNVKLVFDSCTYNELELFLDFLNEHDTDIYRWLTIPDTILPKYNFIINKLSKFK